MANNLIYYRYKIHKDHPNDKISIEDIKLQKDKWHTSANKLDKLNSWIKSMQNPQGFVEYEEFDIKSGNITYKPPAGPPEIFYDRDQLFVMSRDELCNVANDLGISTINIKNDHLMRLILQNQVRFQIPAGSK